MFLEFDQILSSLEFIVFSNSELVSSNVTSKMIGTFHVNE